MLNVLPVCFDCEVLSDAIWSMGVLAGSVLYAAEMDALLKVCVRAP